MGRKKCGETVHPGRACESCAACGVQSEVYHHPENWNDELKQWLVDSQEVDLKACLCKKCERAIRRKWLMSSEGKSGTETAVPQSKRMRANIKCVVPGLYSDDDSSVVACSESVVCASFEGCTVESVGACFGVSPEAVTNACATALPEDASVDKNVIPLCKLHHNQFYRLTISVHVPYELMGISEFFVGIAAVLSALHVVL